MSKTRIVYCRALLMLLLSAAMAPGARAEGDEFSVPYKFQPESVTTFTSPLGSEPDSRPVLGSDGALYGMALGGDNGNGVVYRFDLQSQHYTLLYTFSATDANGYNSDGAIPGVALTRGPGDVFYGTAQFGGQNGNGTIFKITKSGEFTVLHTFSALDANGNNEDGASPLRSIVIEQSGNLYGTTRIGGENTCGVLPVPNGCGVAWVIDNASNFQVLHQFTPAEGHAASLLRARDGFFYGCAVWPSTHLRNGQPLPSGILYRMGAWGHHFQILYRFSQTNSAGENMDGAECYEPLIEARPGVFYGATRLGGANGNGVVFRYALSNPGEVDVLHTFSATNPSGQNWDGANPYARLILDDDGLMYSTASNGGANGNGIVYRINAGGDFHVLHTFSATDPTTGANSDGAVPDWGVIRYSDSSLIGAAALGGLGSPAGLGNSGGTLYELEIGDR
jgi:uncharacterized repeat protein (TIGR03803 family)